MNKLASQNDCKFYGSTSTLTSCLSQIYFMISRWKELNTRMLSAPYSMKVRPALVRCVPLAQMLTASLKPSCFTFGAKLPASIHLKLNKDGSYAVDNDKSYEAPGQQQHLSELVRPVRMLILSFFQLTIKYLSSQGKIMEKMLTTTHEDLERFRSDADPSAVSVEERNAREAYHYTKVRLFPRSRASVGSNAGR